MTQDARSKLDNAVDIGVRLSNTLSSDNKVNQKTSKPRKLCPQCGQPGSGPYSRWVLNSRHKRYEPYQYFAHRQGRKIHWCYLGRQKPVQRCEVPSELDKILMEAF